MNTIELTLSAELRQYLKQAMDYGMSALLGAEPLAPFTMIWRQSDGERLIERFRYGAYDDSLEMALKSVNKQADELKAYAVVWDGYVEMDNQKQEAVITEVAISGQPKAFQIAQPYQQTDMGSKALGDFLFIGETENLLTSPMTPASLSSHLLKPAYQTTQEVNSTIKNQPFTQMLPAGICLAANLFDGNEQERITLGIRVLQKLEQETQIDMSRHALRVIIAAVAEGDFMAALPTDTVEGMMQILVKGGEQLQSAVQKGLVVKTHAVGYLGEVRQAVLTQEGQQTDLPTGGDKLLTLLDKLASQIS